jgi:hypothetical protein
MVGKIASWYHYGILSTIAREQNGKQASKQAASKQPTDQLILRKSSRCWGLFFFLLGANTSIVTSSSVAARTGLMQVML